MKELQRLHDDLKNMRHDLMDNYRTGFAEKFEIVGAFVEKELEDSIGTIDDAIDRIKELEDELAEANNKIDELEREQS